MIKLRADYFKEANSEIRLFFKSHFRYPNSRDMYSKQGRNTHSTILLNLPVYKVQGAGIAHWYSAGLRAGPSGVQVLAGARKLSLHYRVQTG
jgi:hypothetical protein